jgi:hypothetical protein
MRRRRRNKSNLLKLGSLFIIIIFSFSGISASYAHWEEILYILGDMETTTWEIRDCDLKIAYEDLPVGCGNDWDYNDLVVNVSINGTYIKSELHELNFVFEALARGAGYHHTLKLNIPAGTFGANGSYTITYYNTDGSLNSSSTGNFWDISDIDLRIFPDTWQALPPNGGSSWAANVFDCKGQFPGRTTTLSLNFTGYFSVKDVNLSNYTVDKLDNHGTQLFFNLYLYVWDTKQTINQGDVRFIPVPQLWMWPQEYARIWTVYPYNSSGTGRGVKQGANPGNPPQFFGDWYLESPTGNKWDPYCP